jgi:hypothetical protein
LTLNIYQHTIQARLAIGERHAEKNYPIKLDHFIITHPFDPKTKTAPRFKKLEEYFKAKYGTIEPKLVDVVLIDHHPEEVFYTDFFNYPGTTCNCRGNGETAIRTDSDGNKKEIECNYKTCEFRLTKTNKGIINTCKPTGVLSVIIPEMKISGGIIKFTTHSIMTIGKINDALQNIYAIRKTLFGLKVRLHVVMVQVSVGGKNTNVPTVELEIPFSYNEIAEGAGTTIGTLMEAQAKHLSMGALPNKEVMKELSTAAEKEAYDGSNDEIPPTTKSEKPIDVEIVDEPKEAITEDSDEFSF